MADFNPTPNPKNDPSYMGFSQGTDRASLQPLQDVPNLNTKYVQPDYYKNTSLGKLFENVGEFGTGALKLTDNVIKENINKDLTRSINQVRDSFGVAAAADQRTGLAQAAGQSGSEGVSLTNAHEMRNAPMTLQRLGTRIDGLYEAYQQGTLSNSMYYAKMEAEVRRVKAQNPGYDDEVDSMVREKLGVTPANALRAALQDDVAKLANKVQAQNDKWTSWERNNAATISTVYGSYENYLNMKAKGETSQLKTESLVANYDAKKIQQDADLKSIALADATDARKSSRIQAKATEHTTSIVNDTINGLAANMGASGQKLQDYIIAVQNGTRPLPSPEEKTLLAATFAKLEAEVGVKLDEYFQKKPFEKAGDPTTVGSMINDPTKINNIKGLALSRLNIIKEGLFGEKTGLMGLTAQNSKAMEEATTNSVLKSMPSIMAADVIHKRLGDSGIMDIFMGSKNFRDPLLQGFQNYNIGKIATGGYSIRQVLDDAKRENADNGDNNREMVEKSIRIITSGEKYDDPTISQDAVKHVFGPDNRTLIEGVRQSNPRAASVFFNTIHSPEVTKAVSSMPANIQKLYTNAAEDNFTSVYNTEIDNVNQTVAAYKQSGLTLKYDPETTQFRYEGRRGMAPGIISAANGKLIGFNSAIKSMGEVWKSQGNTDVTSQLARLLPVAGIEPGSPVHKLLSQAVLDAENAKANPQ